jgi:hypothetical protein
MWFAEPQIHREQVNPLKMGKGKYVFVLFGERTKQTQLDTIKSAKVQRARNKKAN